MTKERNRDSEILSRLGEWERDEGTLPQFIELYRRLLLLQMQVRSDLTVPSPDLTEEAATDQMRQGLPLLGFDDLSFDWPSVQRQFNAVTETLAQHLTPEVGDAKGLRNVAANVPLLQQVITDWYKGQSLSAIAAEECISEALLSATIQSVLRPLLTAHSEVLLPLVKQELWRRRYCPVCGGKPDFASLDKDRGARWLLCARCDTEWLFQRLECPYCGSQKQQSLSYFADESELYRLYVCDECKAYIKAVDLRRADSEILLPLERIVTLDLDRQADEAGYRPG